MLLPGLVSAQRQPLPKSWRAWHGLRRSSLVEDQGSEDVVWEALEHSGSWRMGPGPVLLVRAEVWMGARDPAVARPTLLWSRLW